MGAETFLDGRVTLHVGDCLDVLAAMPENSVDSVVCDPPYHLTSIVKRFGGEGAAPAKAKESGAFQRASAGFMGKAWDGGDIAFRVETWAAVLRVLKPGGYILAFASTRGFGRMSVAIEDAGFITHPMIGWIFGSGFPKATRIKAEGFDGQRYGGQALKPALEPIYMGQKPFSEETGTANILRWGTGAVNIDACRVGDDGGTAAVNFKKKDDGRNERWDEQYRGARNEIKTINKGRWPANLIHDGSEAVVAAFPEAPGQQREVNDTFAPKAGTAVYGDYGPRPTVAPRDAGGSAARFFYSARPDCHCDLCKMLLAPKDAIESRCNANTVAPTLSTENTPKSGTVHAVAAGSQQRASADRKQQSSAPAVSAELPSSRCHPMGASSAQNDALTQEASRIAPNVRSAASLCGSCETAIAQSLAATRLGLDPASLPSLEFMPVLKRHILLRSLAHFAEGRESTDTITTTASLKTLLGSVFHAIDAITSSGNVASKASSDHGQTPFRYSSKADAEDRAGSRHPTVKPLDLIQYLCRLITPKGGTVLDLFAGTGTTGEAAWREGFNAILIEREAEYADDIRRRMKLAMAGPEERKRAMAAIAADRAGTPADHGPLFGECA